MSRLKPRIAVTLGDPKGIGPEIVAKSLADPSIKKLAHWTIIGNYPKFFKKSDKLAGLLSWQALDEAVQGLKNKKFEALVTAPVSKEHLNLAGFPFPGHTEYLAHHFRAKKTVMMLVSPQLKISLVTIHLSLKQMLQKLTQHKIKETLQITNKALKKDFGIRRPTLAICGLNPHASEGGLFGDEEKKIIIPAIKKIVKEGIKVSGPLPADTIFHLAKEKKFDAIICHYHDQGLIPIKTLDFYEGVNVTLGLPIIRTSPDHGCAFDIAGKGIANPSSMKAAMRLCVAIWKNQKKTYST